MTKPRECKDVVGGGGEEGVRNSMAIYLTYWYLDIHYIIVNSNISQTSYAVTVCLPHTHTAHNRGTGSDRK